MMLCSGPAAHMFCWCFNDVCRLEALITESCSKHAVQQQGSPAQHAQHAQQPLELFPAEGGPEQQASHGTAMPGVCVCLGVRVCACVRACVCGCGCMLVGGCA